jgi:hypothetical protein
VNDELGAAAESIETAIHMLKKMAEYQLLHSIL